MASIVLAMVQAAGADPTFLPDSLNEWFGALTFILVTVATTLGASWRRLVKPVVDSVEEECKARKAADDGVGGRVTSVEERSTRAGERLTMLERAKELAEQGTTRLVSDVGGLSASVQRLADTVNALERERLESQGEIRESLAELNGKLDLFAALNGQQQRTSNNQ